MNSMTWYFDYALDRGATLLDEANFLSNFYPMFEVIKEELMRISNGRGMELGYSYPGGKKELRNLISINESYLEDVAISPEDVTVNSGGCSGTFDNIFRVLSMQVPSTGRDEILISVPTYPGLLSSINFNGLKPVFVNSKYEYNFQPNPDDFAKNITKNTAAIFLISPGNPSCTYIPDSDLNAIIELSRKKNTYLIFDSIYEESPFSTKMHSAFSHGYDNLIKIKSFSKDRPQLNDIRLGWSISKNKDFNELLLKAAETSDYSNSTISERLAIVDMTFRVQLKEGIKKYNSSTLLAYSEELDRFQSLIRTGVLAGYSIFNESKAIDGIIAPDAGNILFARVSDSAGFEGSHELFMYLMNESNIMVSPGHIFYAPRNETWFRITMNRDPKEFEEYSSRIVSLLEARL